jgi:POT family proton-dependent oligopeptide transporter
MIISKENIIFKFSKSFYALFFTELWERFSYYGMHAILLFYLYYSINDGGLGIPENLAISITSIYGSLAFLTGILGGYVGDRFLGAYKSVFYGGILIMFGTHYINNTIKYIGSIFRFIFNYYWYGIS